MTSKPITGSLRFRIHLQGTPFALSLTGSLRLASDTASCQMAGHISRPESGVTFQKGYAYHTISHGQIHRGVMEG